jgi:hypothetical protein
MPTIVSALFTPAKETANCGNGQMNENFIIVEKRIKNPTRKIYLSIPD